MYTPARAHVKATALGFRHDYRINKTRVNYLQVLKILYLVSKGYWATDNASEVRGTTYTPAE